MHLKESQKKALKSNPDSNIVFIEDNYSLAILSLFIDTPTVAGMSGSTPNYEALKDFIRWRSPIGYDVDEIHKNIIPIIYDLSHYVASLHKPQRG